VLKALHLEKTYRQGPKALTVLKDVSLEVKRSEMLSIVGPSGAGKSTLLHILGGLDTPTRGEVFVDGACLTTMDERRQAAIRNKMFGFVFQFYHLLREFTALENVMLPACVERGPQRVSDIREKAEGLLDFLGLSQRLKHRPSSCPAANNSAWPWRGRSSTIPRSFFVTSRRETWILSPANISRIC